MYNKEVKMRYCAPVAFRINRRAEIMFKKMKRILSCALAACGIVACAGSLTACETNNPKVEMTIEFNGKPYTLEYKLYRKITPRTVEHFLWLADGGFYDNTVIHDYDASASKMYGGLYEYVENTASDYFKAKSYNDFCEQYKAGFPISVAADSEGNDPVYTLYGEFEDNNFGVKNGALKEGLGSLSMYYHDKVTEEEVYVKRADSGEFGKLPTGYSYNSATSMFYISLSTTEQTQRKYCTFATLLEDSQDEFEDLQEAIAEYIKEKYNEESADFVTPTSMKIDQEDRFVASQDKSKEFNIPKQAIIIRSVKVLKY